MTLLDASCVINQNAGCRRCNHHAIVNVLQSVTEYKNLGKSPVLNISQQTPRECIIKTGGGGGGGGDTNNNSKFKNTHYNKTTTTITIIIIIIMN